MLQRRIDVCKVVEPNVTRTWGGGQTATVTLAGLFPEEKLNLKASRDLHAFKPKPETIIPSRQLWPIIQTLVYLDPHINNRQPTAATASSYNLILHLLAHLG